MGKEEVKISNEIIGAAIDVHKNIRSGLLESLYEECLYIVRKFLRTFIKS